VISQIHDGQTQVHPLITQLSDGQSHIPAIFQIGDAQLESTTKRQLPSCLPGHLTVTLSYGSLLDEEGRYGYIAGGNNQFQFDIPVQSGGYGQFNFSVCGDAIAFMGNSVWWKCDTGEGFSNLYDAEISFSACEACRFIVVPCL
jgi:hypothetical protein